MKIKPNEWNDSESKPIGEAIKCNYELLREVRDSFAKAVASMDRTSKSLTDIFSAIGGRMLPFDMNKLGPDAMDDFDMTDDGFMLKVASILKTRSMIERMDALTDIAKRILSTLQSFVSKRDKLRDRADKMLGPKDKKGKRVKSEAELNEIKSNPEYVAAQKLCVKISSTINTLEGRLNYVCNRFFEARKAALLRVLGHTELLNECFGKAGMAIGTEHMTKHSISYVLDDMADLDDRMYKKARAK